MKSSCLLLALFVALSLSGCSKHDQQNAQRNAEKTGQKIEQGAEKAGNEVKKAAEKAGDEVKTATDSHPAASDKPSPVTHRTHTRKSRTTLASR